MYKYNKMKTLFTRDEDFKVTDEVSCKEFKNVCTWLVTEKIDGTNVRIVYHPKQNEEYRNNPATLEMKGKKDTSDMPLYLLHRLNQMFDLRKFMEVFPDVTKGVCLYGEGYGAKIRSGGNYNKEHNFRLFDVWLDGWWLDWDNVKDVANKLGIKTAPVIAITNMEEAVELVKRKEYSQVALQETGNYYEAEGIVARAYPMMLFRDGTPIKWKLKVKDYSNGGGVFKDKTAGILKEEGGYLLKKDSPYYKSLMKDVNNPVKEIDHDALDRAKIFNNMRGFY